MFASFFMSMDKCKKCRHYRVRLKCLACEQEAEKKHRILKPEIITPLKNIPLSQFTDKEKAVLLLKIVAELSLHRIAPLLGIDRRTTTLLFKEAYKKLRRIKLF